jgi:hypothetical protein
VHLLIYILFHNFEHIIFVISDEKEDPSSWIRSEISAPG